MHQPHDKLVKRLLSSPDIARDILELYLPPEILSIVDLNKLELQRDSFIDDEHRMNAVDLLYKTTFQHFHHSDGYIWILLEHQRQSDFWMPVRLFKYMAIIWDHIRKTSPSNTIPLIYPVVIYNGDRPWHHSLNLSELIEPDASRKIFADLFNEPFCLIDLATIPDESLRNAAQTKVKAVALLMALKHVFSRNLQSYLEQTLKNVLIRVDQGGDSDTVMDIISYLFKENKFLDVEQVSAILNHQFSDTVEEQMPTIFEQYVEKGRQKGVEEGIEQGIEQGVKTVMGIFNEYYPNIGMDLLENLHRATGLPIEKIKSLAKSS